MYKVLILILLLILSANADVTGSIGIGFDKTKDTHALGGMFGEINNGNIGGFLSLTGTQSRDGRASSSHIAIGMSYLLLNWLGVVGSVGIFNSLKTTQRIRLHRDPPIDEDNGSHGYYEIDVWDDYAYTTGVGVFLYIIKRFLTVSLKWFGIPGRGKHYWGAGVGFHLQEYK